ncbi:protein translocase subunit SecDF [Pedobacter mucosus]|uniref:protein translocase subunit SecDF n=1 Tax=Pedobacter mucosus TaxID=2895286 RepID=UPI001EE3B31F|nr:protein translocase subunit SecDF [Pedobacter mucosus]UKT62329.1 protein translocase subunit SecDF [Pedobacter mucosus]
MQGKGFIKFIAIVLAIVCAYALSFTLVSSSVEKDAKNYAKGNLAKEKAYLDSMGTVKVYPLLGFTYQEVKSKEINLGLDLKGGMNVTMEISLSELVKSLAGNPTDANFNTALQNAQTQLNAGGKDYIKLFVNEFEKLSPNTKLADYFSNQDNATQLKSSASNGEVQSFLEKEATSAIDRSFFILRSRIDGFGVVSPNMQKQEGSNRILIEMPGVQDKDRISKLLQGSAELQFWQVYQVQEVVPLLENINKTLAATLKDTATVANDTTTKAATGGKLAGLEKAGVKDSLAKGGKLAGLGKKDSTAAKAAIAKSNPLFSVLSIPTYTAENGQQQLRPGPIVAWVAQKDTSKVNSYFKLPEVAAAIPSTMKFMWSVKPMEGSKVFELYAIKVTSADGKPDLGGESVSDSRNDFDQKGKPEVTMYMTSEGSAKWKKITAEAASDANNKKAIAIVLDNAVYSAPTVQNEITGGVSSITGNFTQEDTKDLSNILKAGKLPAPARIAGSFVVGPTLGAQAIHDGLISFIIAFIVILIFMALYYHRAGWVANFALLINLFFIMGILVSLGAVLTLPGIAGIVLVIGLSVDANILIFERVREELALGKNTALAIKEGFKHAMPSIIDSNVTLFILGAILYVFGSGPVQGFATTLCIGILSSLFAAVAITRVIFDSLINRKIEVSFDNKLTRNAFKDISFDFVGRRKIYYVISTAIIILGFVFYFKNGGLNLGVDFKGGRTYLVHFDKAVNTEDLKTKLNPVFGNETPEVKTAGEDSQVKITTTFHIEDQNPKTDKVVEDALVKGLATTGIKYEIASSQKVTPIIASDIVNGAFYAVLISCLFMFIYIVVRFKKWQYGLGAVIALFHDVLMVLSFYTILDGVMPFSLEIGQDFIAAILTVMGYTMTETVVVFDRIREKLKESGKEDLHGEERNNLINFALNSTLSRTILTSLTVFFVLLVIFIFGGDSIRGFIFALLIGRIIGTYSSLCISTPIVIDLGSSAEKKK